MFLSDEKLLFINYGTNCVSMIVLIIS